MQPKQTSDESTAFVSRSTDKSKASSSCSRIGFEVAGNMFEPCEIEELDDE
jgi:hypothetical protein